jgi:hypothetical protein
MSNTKKVHKKISTIISDAILEYSLYGEMSCVKYADQILAIPELFIEASPIHHINNLDGFFIKVEPKEDK